MPLIQPTPRQAHVDKFLTNLSLAYSQDPANFGGMRLFARVPVLKQSDIYLKYLKSFWHRSEMKLRAPGTESAGSGFGLDKTNKYFCDNYALHVDVSNQYRANADAPINPDRDATEYLTQQMLIKQEKDFVAKAFATGKWDTVRAGVASGPTGTQFLQWEQPGSTPIEEIRGDIVAIAGVTGKKPNKLGLGPDAFKALLDHADVLERIKYTGGSGNPAVVNELTLAQLFGLDEVVVLWGVENTAVEGAASDSHGFINAKDALLVYTNPAPSIMKPSGGYTFMWTGLIPGGQGQIIRRIPAPLLDSDRIEIEGAWDFEVVGPDLGIFYNGAVG